MVPWQALAVGVGLGLGAGLTPGPLLALVIAETLRGGWRAGVLVALAPPIADAAVIALCLLVLTRLSAPLTAGLSIGGGLYVLFLGWETLRMAAPTTVAGTGIPPAARQSLGRGIAVNLLNPHPYLFWLTVGGPLVTESYRQAAWAPIAAFVGGFYSCLVGSKVGLALLVHAGRARLHGRGYRLALRLSAGVLVLLGAMLLWEGTLGLWPGIGRPAPR